MPPKRKRPDEPPSPAPRPQYSPVPPYQYPSQPQPQPHPLPLPLPPTTTQQQPAGRATRNTPVQPPPIPPQYHYLAPQAAPEAVHHHPLPAQEQLLPAKSTLVPPPEPRRTRGRPPNNSGKVAAPAAVPSQPQLASLARAALQATSMSWTPARAAPTPQMTAAGGTCAGANKAAAAAAARPSPQQAATRNVGTAGVAAPARSAPAKTSPVKKSPAKKSPVKNSPAKNPPAKGPTPKKSPIRNPPTSTTRGRPPQSNLVAPEITYHSLSSSSHRKSALVRPHGPSAPPPKLQPATVTPVYPPKPPAGSSSQQHHPAAHAERAVVVTPRPDRNIDKVVLGNVCFRTWYPSYYGKEVLGDLSGHHAGKSGSKADSAGGGGGGSGGGGGGSGGGSSTGSKGKDETGGKAGGKAAASRHHHLPAVLERLYVCPCCFKYSKELVAWWRHVRVCERRAYVPGHKVYAHPRGRRKVLMPHDGKVPAPGAKRRRGEGGVKYIEEVVQDEGEWSIWEVDGEQDPLFCQNLSLFAKLFLDNKSVFFDVSGFNYFLLVYTPPPPKDLLPSDAATTDPSSPATANISAPSDPDALLLARPHITGFFSKEKMSWDNNNLACILVFPPWQRKGLGALLMGASYEISRREGILGGPEKPISELGRRGYKRFWAGEIARWLLGLEDRGRDVSGDGGGGGVLSAEVLVDVDDCSRATWIHPDDCLLVLRDMGVVEEAGMGPGKPPRVDKAAAMAAGVAAAAALAAEAASGGTPPPPPPTTTATTTTTTTAAAAAATTTAALDADKQQSPPQEPEQQVKMVPRVRVDKQAVRRYVAQHRIYLERTCDADGFVEGYAMKKATQAKENEQEGGEKNHDE